MRSWTTDRKSTRHLSLRWTVSDQVISILIEFGSNYSYVSPELVGKRDLSKELHAESWLV